MKLRKRVLSLILLFGLVSSPLWHATFRAQTASAQESLKTADRGAAKPMTIPVGIRVRGSKPQPEIQSLEISVSEDGEPQELLSIRAVGTSSPITIAILIQDDLVASAANEIKPIGEFIRNLPKGSRVMIAYVRAGTLDVRQKFTTDLERGTKALRAPMGLASAAPFNPYVEVSEALKRFDSQPTGRRALLLVSDGLDVSRGVDSSSPGQSIDLQRAINQSQRRSVAIYSFYEPSVTIASGGNQILIGNAQSSLERLSSETGGRAFFQGTGAAVSFDPFLRDLSQSLDRQFALTYLSTHTSKGFHRLQIRSLTVGIDLTYPAGYRR